MIIERDSDELYNEEYDVLVRRLTGFLSQSVPVKEGFGACLVKFAPGEKIREHVNKPGVEETFIMLDGTADFYLDGETHELRPGDIAFAPIGLSHSFVNTSDVPGRMICIWWRAAEQDAPAAAAG